MKPIETITDLQAYLLEKNLLLTVVCMGGTWWASATDPSYVNETKGKGATLGAAISDLVTQVERAS